MNARWGKRSNETSRWFCGANHIGDYMRRWYLQTPWFTVRLHHILRSDEARALHDHPWSFVSLLLTGGYTEITSIGDPADDGPTIATWHPRWSIVRRKAGTAHRLILTRPVWTLVLTGPAVRKWGFYIPGAGWTYWREAMQAWAGGRP